jgi:hypothetical protein
MPYWAYSRTSWGSGRGVAVRGSSRHYRPVDLVPDDTEPLLDDHDLLHIRVKLDGESQLRAERLL